MVRVKDCVITTICVFCFLWNIKADTTDFTYKPVGYGSLEVGQINSGYYKKPGLPTDAIDHVWQQRAYCYFGYDVLVKKRLEVSILGGGLVAYSTPQVGTDPQTMQTRNFFFLKEANAAYSFFNTENYSLKMKLGYFPFKYNPEVRNLGENLFRTNAYPLLVYSDFDYPKADILGLQIHFQGNVLNNLIHFQEDLLLHSELYSMPVQNWSLSDVLSATVLDAFTLGGGVSFCNLFSVYQGKYGAGWMDQNYKADTSTVSGKNSFFLKNQAGTDSALFDWKSTKVMMRCSFDPKKFIPGNIFGSNDLKVYGEIDLIGLKNYPLYFTNLKDRTFYCVGFNLPGFKIVDVINAEVEFCEDTSAFSDEGFYSTTPRISPTEINANSLTGDIKRDPFRWSVYIKKSFLNEHVSFILQCARDHRKINFYYFKKDYISFIETLPEKNNLWWTFKAEFKF